MLHLAQTFWAAIEKVEDIVGGISEERMAAAAAGWRTKSLGKECIWGEAGGVEVINGNGENPLDGISLRLRICS